MAPTRQYLNKNQETPLIGALFVTLFVAAVLGGLVWLNIIIWSAIF